MLLPVCHCQALVSKSCSPVHHRVFAAAASRRSFAAAFPLRRHAEEVAHTVFFSLWGRNCCGQLVRSNVARTSGITVIVGELVQGFSEACWIALYNFDRSFVIVLAYLCIGRYMNVIRQSIGTHAANASVWCIASMDMMCSFVKRDKLKLKVFGERSYDLRQKKSTFDVDIYIAMIYPRRTANYIHNNWSSYSFLTTGILWSRTVHSQPVTWRQRCTYWFRWRGRSSKTK